MGLPPPPWSEFYCWNIGVGNYSPIWCNLHNMNVRYFFFTKCWLFLIAQALCPLMFYEYVRLFSLLATKLYCISILLLRSARSLSSSRKSTWRKRKKQIRRRRNQRGSLFSWRMVLLLFAALRYPCRTSLYNSYFNW